MVRPLGKQDDVYLPSSARPAPPPGLRAHVVGIGGSGMSAIAMLLDDQGVSVTGSDVAESRTVAKLRERGIAITVPHAAKAVDGATVLLPSAAISDTNVEVSRARELGIPIVRRGAALAQLFAGLRVIGVAGAHGKTTTTSMVVAILEKLSLSPTYFVGGEIPDRPNARVGTSKLGVAELDDSDGTLFEVPCFVPLVTSVDVDHMDYWGSQEVLEAGFIQFAADALGGGMAVVPAKLETFFGTALARTGFMTYGDNGDVSADEVDYQDEGSSFLAHGFEQTVPVTLAAPGAHNVRNALAAISAAVLVGVAFADACDALSAFRALPRRVEKVGVYEGVTFIDDNADHPRQIAEVINTIGRLRPKRIIGVFAPHRYTRAATFLDEWASALKDVASLVVLPVNPASETPCDGATSQDVADSVKRVIAHVTVAGSPEEAAATLLPIVRGGDIVLGLGARSARLTLDHMLGRLDATTRRV